MYFFFLFLEVVDWYGRVVPFVPLVTRNLYFASCESQTLLLLWLSLKQPSESFTNINLLTAAKEGIFSFLYPLSKVGAMDHGSFYRTTPLDNVRKDKVR
jgi:hypothetical protein